MIPKFSTSLLHLNAARVVAATTQTVTPTFRNVLQHQSQQQAAASASSSTTVGWTAGAGATGATSSASSSAANAKFQSGGRFYTTYQQATQDPSFAANQQDEEEKRKRNRQGARKATLRPMSHQLIRRSTSSALIPSSRLAHTRLLQTKSYHRVTKIQEPEETGSESRALVPSPPRRHYSTSPGEEGAVESLGSSAGSAHDVETVPSSRSSVHEALEESTQEVLELMQDEPLNTFDSTDPSAPQSVVPPKGPWNSRTRTINKVLNLVVTARDPKSKIPVSVLKAELETIISNLRRVRNRDSNTWSSVLWATIALRQPGEDLRRSIDLYNSLLSGAFIPTDEYLPSNDPDAGVIIPSEKIISTFIRSLVVRDQEVFTELHSIDRWNSIYTPIRQPVPKSMDQEERARLEKENNFAPAMALVAATLQQPTPLSLGAVTYNLLLESADRHGISNLEAQDPKTATPTTGGIPSAITIFAHLEKSGCRPNARTFEKLLQVYAGAGDLEGVQEVWNEFRSACARGSIDWLLQDNSPAQVDVVTGVPNFVPWKEKAGPLHPDQPLVPASIAALISVWTAMIRAHFRCGDAAGGLAILEKMMDSPFTPSSGGFITPVDVPPPAFNTYHAVISGFLEMGDVETAIAWFKRLLQQQPSEIDEHRREPPASWPKFHKWLPLAAPPRPERMLWDIVCHQLYERGAYEELNELFDFTNDLRSQYVLKELPGKLQAAIEAAEAKHGSELPAEQKIAIGQQVSGDLAATWDARDAMHWSIVWRANVTALEARGMPIEKRREHLDWLRTRMIDRVFASKIEGQRADTAEALELELDGQAEQSNKGSDIFSPVFSGVRDRAWHVVGLYITQGRMDEGIELATRLYDIENKLIAQQELYLKNKLKMREAGRRRRGITEVDIDPEAPSAEVLQRVAHLRSLVSGLEERMWTYGSEARQYPSLKALAAQLELNNRAGLIPAMRSAWYFANAFLSHRNNAEIASLESTDWPNLGRIFAATAMSVFYEDNRPRPNPENAWQIVAFLQILHDNGKTFADIGRHNVFRIYKILEYHLGVPEVSKLMQRLGTGFLEPEQYFPRYVQKSGASETPVTEPPAVSQDVQTMIDEARGITNGPPKVIDSSLIGHGQAPENRSTQPLVINPGQSAHVGDATRSAGSPHTANQLVSAEVAFERLLAGYAAGEVPAPESIARLIVQLGYVKAKAKVIRCYGICNEILSILEPNKSWQASAWFALEDAMVTALAHCGDMKAASIHRSRLVAQGSAPSANSYGALIANIKDTTDNAAVAIELFEESRRLNVEPTSFLYNTIISRLAKARKADYAMMLFQNMKQAGLAPTEVTYGAVIAGCARIGDSTTAEILFEEMRALPGYRPRIPPFNTMMQLYTHVKPNRERALHYYELMQQMGVEPTPYSYKLLLDAYGSIEPVSINQMEEIIERMKEKRVEISGNHYSSLILAHGCSKHDLEAAIKVFESLRKRPQRVQHSLFPRGGSRVTLPDVLVYESILNVCITHHRYDLMEKYYTLMTEQDRIRPTAYICNLLIKGRASEGNLQGARDIFEAMQDPPAGAAAPNNHAPHVSNEGVELVNGSIVGNVKDPVFREPSSWEAMVRAELSGGDRQRATALLQRMKARCYPAAITAKIEGILWEPAVAVEEGST
ncbi:hypothetical protein FRC17_009708 [Serendipita sp. 399]|nr:hypothetical protein FRC17_009708 [Serendipita sp. 399]